ncbi:hypothetical protein SRB5_45230 [Streptomyces sp. RB5]|uniref:Lipoprotein n=1 Tax=Streptomyces smaragdinus TaxID=2585196 RepID=A0A7K0CLJ5_9ACTN|nr:hypothetical protein [Streptomyces smaragdinus]MQY14357.1 hypothetical protein [Streptomyces smaragdinus]
MNTSRRHTAKGWLTVIAISTLVLTGCGRQGGTDAMEPAGAAKPAASPAAKAKEKTEQTPSSPTTEPTARPSAATKKPTAKPTAEPSTPAAKPSAKPSKPAPKAPFAGTAPFVNINRAWTAGGRTYVSVRVAEKKINTRFDTWEIIPGTGPFTTVPLAKNARIGLTAQVRGDVAGHQDYELLPYSPTQFVTVFNKLDPAFYNGTGFDLVVDASGQITSMQSLFRP